ncbi:unnamed protein product [Schistocephalus solidus]|uniref:Dynein light chain n=1 Tax=Schistocephalus solidus TaxID=70667 RepID=A0A183SQ43_SCHSO|nr:unnamed protein product [Schistocephalus solidus]
MEQLSSVVPSRRVSLATRSHELTQHRKSTKSTLQRTSFSLWRFQRLGRHQPVRFENTYRTGPNPDEKFNVTEAKHNLQQLLASTLADVTYSPERAAQLATNLANLVRKQARGLEQSPRYKVVALVHIGALADASVYLCSRAIWSVDCGDSYAEASYSNNSLYAVATLYAVYFE